MDNPADQYRRPSRLFARLLPFAVWGILIIGIASLFITQELGQARHRFHDLHGEFHRHITVLQKTHEVAIDSFAAFLSANPGNNMHDARMFARNLINHYPDLYMLEIAKRVPHSQREDFERQMRMSGYPDFEIHSFNYDSDRKSQIVPDKEVYYPIVFIEPELEQARSVLGLDLSDSSSILKDALERSFNKRIHVASRPFTLIEGNQGYLLYREVDKQQGATLELIPRQDLYALLVIDSSTLIPSWARNTANFYYSLTYPDARSVNQGLLSQTIPDDTLIDNSLFPVFEHESKLESRSQPFTLRTQYHTSLSDISPRHLVVFLLVCLATIPLPLWLSRLLYRRSVLQVQELERTYQLANYDSLTGLPNKNLASELFHQLSTIVKRHDKKLGLLYIDLDNFKQVNDKYGHQAGDQLLQHVAERLSGALRESDTLVRLHGDEFVIFVSEINTTSDLDKVIEKINSVFKHTVDLNGEHFTISMSIGTSVYPDDGNTFDQLLGASDRSMYRNKHSAHKNVTPLFKDQDHQDV